MNNNDTTNKNNNITTTTTSNNKVVDENESRFVKKKINEIFGVLTSNNKNKNSKSNNTVRWERIREIWYNDIKPSPYVRALCMYTEKHQDTTLLMWLIAKGSPLDIVQQILEVCPETIQQRDVVKRSVYHYALRKHASLETVKALLDVCPEVAKEKSLTGWTALSYAIENGVSDDIILSLIDANPETSQEKDLSGRTPLQHGMECRLKSNVIKALLNAYPDAAKGRDEKGRVPLYRGITLYSSYLDVIQALLDAYPGAVVEKDNWGWTPLYCAIRSQTPSDVIIAMINTMPDAVKDKDESGRTFLHWSLKKKAPLDVIKAIVDVYPGAVAETDRSGRTPLGMALENEVSQEIIDVLLDADSGINECDASSAIAKHVHFDPEPTTETVLHNGVSMLAPPLSENDTNDSASYNSFDLSNHGMTELHSAIDTGDSYETIKALLDANPDAAKEKDDDGTTPLLLAVQFDASEEIIMAVLKAYPGAAKEKDNFGKIPLLSIQSTTSLNVVKALLKAYPDGTKEKNSRGWTVLHNQVGQRDPSLGVVKALLETNMDIAGEKNDNGQTPLHLAILSGRSLDVIKFLLDIYPNASKMKDGDGMTPLHYFACSGSFSEEGDKLRIFKALLAAYPEAIREKTQLGYTPLHCVLKVQKSFEEVELLLLAGPDVAKEKDRCGQTPFHHAIQCRQASTKVLKMILESSPDVAMEKDEDGRTPLHEWISAYETYGAQELSLCILKSLIKAYPHAVKAKDNFDQTPVHIGMYGFASFDYMQVLLGEYPEATFEIEGLSEYIKDITFKKSEKIGYDHLSTNDSDLIDATRYNNLAKIKHIVSAADKNDRRRLVQNLLSNYFQSLRAPPDHFRDDYERGCQSAGRIENNRAIQPEAVLRSLQLVRKWLQDGRALHQLCHRSDRSSILSFFAILSDTEIGTPKNIPCLDLNEEPISGWTPLEILVDADTEDASGVFFETYEQLTTSSDIEIEVTTTIRDIWNRQYTLPLFKSVARVNGITWDKIADRAKQANTDKLRKWGQTYGRLLGKYRINSDEDPKHISDTCVVVFGTELRQGKGNKKMQEVKVALKFMVDDNSFKREIESRSKISCNIQVDFVVGIRAAFTSRCEKDLTFESRNDINIYYDQDLPTELNGFDRIRLQSKSNGVQQRKLNHLLVMDCGTGSDLSDVLSHQNIARVNLPMAIHIARSIAEDLQDLNEQCGVMHGDVKARNFVSLAIGGEYAVIDLDNAARIGVDSAGQKRTSSGYLPPEQASIEYSLRIFDGKRDDPQALEKINLEIDKLKKRWMGVVSDSTLDFDEKAKESDAIRKAITEAEKKKQEVESPTRPKDVVASAQYDMWCFGVLLFYMCTGEQLFRVDNKEHVTSNDELLTIMNWDEDIKSKRLEAIPDGWPKTLVSDLLQRDPVKRPQSWDTIISRLGSFKSESTRHLELVGIIRSEARMLKDSLKRIEESINNIPDFLVQMENVHCPYLFQIVTKDDFEKFQADNDVQTEPDGVMTALNRAESYFKHASEILQYYLSGNLKEKAKSGILNQAWSKMTGKKKDVLYLQLLCGWTFQPVVTYKVETTTYAEEFVKVAELGAKVCTVAIKLAILWNVASDTARMFGYPIPNVPQDQVEKAYDFLTDVDKSEEINSLREKEREGLDLSELDEFDSFLQRLEEEGKMRHMQGDFNKENLKGRRWREALKVQHTQINGKKKVTYVSSKEVEKMGPYNAKDHGNRIAQ